ncbi:MAG: cupin domain-containing protein [Planctomycetes bacterium]|nr:cupin domain-containing protein [Planctomycetota bacterium]
MRRPPRLALCCLLALPTFCPSQATPPPAVEWLPAAELGPRLAASTPWLSLVDRATMTVGRYRLAAGATDGQTPHDRDEVYYVLGGKAQFTVGDETRAVGAGDMVFVMAAAEHRFHDIEADLDLLVFFSTVTPASGGMAAGPKPLRQTPYDETSARGAARIFYWYGPDSAGQLVLDHGRPRWNVGYEKFLTAPSGRRWRFGENFWTTLDTNIPLTLGGVEVAAGQYYCVLQNTAQKGLELLLLDPATVRARHLDAYEAQKTTGGLGVPLRRQRAPFAAGRLAVTMTVDRSRDDHGQLDIHFGPHLLSADLVMHPALDNAAASEAPTAAEAAVLPAAAAATAMPAAAAADVASIDAIIAALYATISGPAGQQRNWDRLRSLFHQDARLMPIVKTGAGMHTVVMTVDDYIARSGPFLEQSGFFEHEIARRTDAFGDFAQVFSTYEGRRAEGDAEPFLRGINSLQLVHENDRWYVLQIVWQQERDAGPIPARYLPGK